MRILQAVLSLGFINSLLQLQPKFQRDNIEDASLSKPGEVGGVDYDFKVFLLL